MNEATAVFAPAENRVLIRQDKAPGEKKKGAIILAGKGNERPNFGEVIAVGPGKKRDDGSRTPMTIQVGFHVAYPPYAVVPVEIGGEEFLLVDEPAILGYFTKGK